MKPTSRRAAEAATGAPGGETAGERSRRVARILAVLKRTYPDARTALVHANPYQLLVATILSAQCTDRRVNMVTPALFARYPDARALARARPAALEKLIHSTGFYRNKAKNLIAAARGMVTRHAGLVPDTMAALTALDGVGRKTANVVLGDAFGKQEGIVVDTHVNRISRLLDLTPNRDPQKVEADLMRVVPRPDWTLWAHLLIAHGRAICVARRPRCGACPLYDLCPGRRVPADGG